MAENDEGLIRRMRNLAPYRNKTDDEIREAIAAKASTRKTKQSRPYDERFNEKFEALKEEFGLDMNSSNDVETLTLLVRQLIQSENTDRSIISIQAEDLSDQSIKDLKSLGDFQRDLTVSITDLQEKLGISRKTRKEKSVDDLPIFIEELLHRAKTTFNRETVIVVCDKCDIEVIRYWLNFPDLTTQTQFITECPQCGEKIVYNR